MPLPRGHLSTIPCTELPEDSSGTAAARNWNLYRRMVARLLAEGHERQWVLIQDEKIIGIWQTQEEANQVRLQRFLIPDAGRIDPPNPS